MEVQDLPALSWVENDMASWAELDVGCGLRQELSDMFIAGQVVHGHPSVVGGPGIRDRGDVIFWNDALAESGFDALRE